MEIVSEYGNRIYHSMLQTESLMLLYTKDCAYTPKNISRQ